MRSFATHLRLVAGSVLVAAALLVASPAQAQSPYAISINVAGLSGGGNYYPAAFAWGPAGGPISQGVAPELTFTVSDDVSSVTLMQAAAAGQLFSTAELQEQLQGTTTVDILMSDVRVKSVRIAGNLLTANTLVGGPELIVTLRFSSVTYTFQPVLPNGQKAGPPVTYSATF